MQLSKRQIRKRDALARRLEDEPGIESPYGLATWIVRQDARNPSRRWEPVSGGLALELAGGEFRLLESAEPVTEPGWSGWQLLEGDDVVAAWQLDEDSIEAARVIAEAWIDAWCTPWE